ncbi:carboxymuconolactone decarboxylase family protein [Paenibacillus sp. LS1]|uniref:carboxymuconolactone decarboxylase family protein n=1 Tax=Paenibacillus sp. LS1 TaxID=2992120 RepID=UPI0022323F3F|nr:carboxymuconolactone decarboxylase family protein [Paenibacillus sp. LS1]MCW3790435.1 carboxymuconolactone decarboxylase family protein [Paenibacillus sp. LS1]
MTQNLYTRPTPAASTKLFAYAPEAFQAFGEFNKQTFAEGALTVKVKEYIAVAAAHITGCPYCIEAHVGKAKGQEATFEELLEAVAVAAAINAHSAFYNSIHTWNAYNEEANTELYALDHIERIERLEETNEGLYTSFVEYINRTLVPERIGVKDKLLIAVGASHVTGNAYSIEIFTRKAKAEGVTLEELAETILVASALKAGAAIAHRVNALAAYERE